MKRAEVYYKNSLAGILAETDAGYEFCYIKDYLVSKNAEPVSLTLPLTDKPYHSNVLFPFFDGLIPEGWLLDVIKSLQTAKWTSTNDAAKSFSGYLKLPNYPTLLMNLTHWLPRLSNHRQH